MSKKNDARKLVEVFTELLQEIKIDDPEHNSKVLRVIAGATIGLIGIVGDINGWETE